MQFRVLGALEVLDGAAAVVLPRGRARVVLAMLLLHANRVVPADHLVEAAWDGHEPSTARTQIHGFVSALRRALAAAGPDQPIVTQDAGYLLRVGPDELDLDAFQRHVVTARDARRRGKLDQAADGFAQALRLWRGGALDGIPASRLLEAEAVRLDRLRLAAVEEHARIELDLGRHDRVGVELLPFVRDHPLHEGLHELLMVALHRSGRRDQALMTYQEVRRALVDQLGVEPGPALRRLHQRILAADPELDMPARAEQAILVPRPAQLPPDLMDFTARRSESDELAERLSRRDALAVVTVTGTPGVGKTSLAVHVAHRVRGHFPDGQLYVDLQGAGDRSRAAHDVLARFMRDLGAESRSIPMDEDERAARYRSMLAERRVLIVLDNARDAAQVRPLLPGAASCAVLVTSRDSLAGLPGYRMTLDALSGDQALHLLRRIVGADRLTAEPLAATRLVELCAGLPLALRIAGARLAIRSVWRVEDLVHRLAAASGRLDELTVGDLTVRASLAVSYDNLPTATDGRLDPARAFRLLGLWQGPPLGTEGAAALFGTSEDDARHAMEVLLDAHLVQSTSPDRFGFHDLLRVYAAERALAHEPDTARDLAVRRVVAWYLETVGNADRQLSPGRRPVPAIGSAPQVVPLGFADRDEALTWTVAELPCLLAAVRQAADHGSHDIAWRLSFVLYTVLTLQGRWNDWIAAQQTGLASARRIGDRYGEGCLLNSLAIAFWQIDRLEEAAALLEDALVVRRELDDRVGVVTCLNNLGILQRKTGLADRAVVSFTEALAINEQVDDPHMVGVILNGLADAYQSLGRFDAALDFHHRALAAHNAVHDTRSEGISLNGLGTLLTEMGRPDEAIPHHQRALAIARQISDRYLEATCLADTGNCLDKTGKSQDAAEHWRAALAIMLQLGDPRATTVRTLLASHPSTTGHPSHLVSRHSQ